MLLLSYIRSKQRTPPRIAGVFCRQHAPVALASSNHELTNFAGTASTLLKRHQVRTSLTLSSASPMRLTTSSAALKGCLHYRERPAMAPDRPIPLVGIVALHESLCDVVDGARSRHRSAIE
jgi:hypothetical protein